MTKQSQGALWVETVNPEAVEIDGFSFPRIDTDPPATPLADYYGAIAQAVRSLGRARSNQQGFPQLTDSSEPVREYSYRLDKEPEETKQLISKTASKHRFRAQDVLNRLNQAEYSKLTTFAQATGAFTVEQVQKAAMLPPSIVEVEFTYFDDPDKNKKDLQAKRTALYAREKRYKKPRSKVG